MSRTSQGRRYADSLHREAGWALGRCAPMQKHLASALDYDPSWIHRQVKAKRPGPVGRFFEELAKLATHDRCNPGPLVAQALVVMTEALDSLEDGEPEKVFRWAVREEFQAQAREDEATQEALYWMERRDEGPEAWAAWCRAIEKVDEAIADEVGLEILKLVAARALKLRAQEGA